MGEGGEDGRVAAEMERRCGELSAELRAGVARAADARAEALFETAAEVVDGLARAMRHYRDASEPAWREE
jgi:hypothetical protein